MTGDPLIPESTKTETSEAVEREGCIGGMTPERAAYFLQRFKRDEKMLGPHEQWALDYAIAALSAPPAGQNVERMREALERIERMMSLMTPLMSLNWRRNNEAAIVQASNDFADLRAHLQPAAPSVAIGAGEVGRVADMIRSHFGGSIIRDEWYENGHPQSEEHDACEDVDSLASEIVAALNPPSASIPADVERLVAKLRDWAPGLTAVRKDCLEAADMIERLAALPSTPQANDAPSIPDGEEG